MSKFLVTSVAPKQLKQHEYVIDYPNFYSEISSCKLKKPKSEQITINYLREVVAAVCQKYLGKDFDVLRSINVSKFVGAPYNTEKDVHDVLIKIFENQCPELIHAYVQACFKQRPSGTNLIYYTGNPNFCTKLLELGYEQISKKEFENLDKPKKIVGKPAISNEQANILNEDIV